MEFVFVVPRPELFRDCYPQGLVPFGSADAAEPALAREPFETRVREHGFFVERERAERDPNLKQIIPYTLVHARGHGRGQEGVLLMRRLARGGETRLHQKLSIGVGGHINPEDAGDGRDQLVAAGTRRELEEELVIDGHWRLETVGLLNDDSNPVGAVHLGLVQVLHLEGTVDIREEDVLEGSLVDTAELQRLAASGANFETWSSLLVERLDELLPETQSVTT